MPPKETTESTTRTTFTPGPWTVPHFATDHPSCDCISVLSEHQQGMGAIASVHHSRETGRFAGENEEPERAKANAHLIASAPELLEALAYCRDRLQAVWNRAGSLGAKGAAEMADRAIAKARGES